MGTMSPFGRLNGKHGLGAAPAAFPAGVPILGQPIDIHAIQFNVTITCKCSEPHPVLIFDGRRYGVCPKCRAVYGVKELRGTALPAPNQHGEVLGMHVTFGRLGTAVADGEETPEPTDGAPGGSEPGEGDGQ